jgi:neutral ceramidase
MSCGKLFIQISLILVWGISTLHAGAKAGVSQTDITPEGPIWLSGYAARTHASDGVAMRLKAKALALEDGKGARVVLVSTDLIGLPGELSDWVAARVQQEHGLARASIVFNSSHTHTGPVVRGNLMTMYDLSPEQWAAVEKYRKFLSEQLVTVIGAALGGLQPATLDFGQGQAQFGVNRRARTTNGIQIGVNPDGPRDPSVPVLRVRDARGKIFAVLFGYACHNTTLTGDFYSLSADYAGYAQAEVEREIPGATALFYELCGGDQNPNPRSKFELAGEHGRTLGQEVVRVTKGNMTPVAGRVRAAFQLIDLPLAPHTRQQFEAEAQDTHVYKARRAKAMLKLYDERRAPRAVRYPVQAVRFEKGFSLIALGGEVVVDYALWAKQEWNGQPLMVAGYCNDVMSYIPNKRILGEGGYEALDSMIYYGMPGPYTEEVEERIKTGVRGVWKRTGR